MRMHSGPISLLDQLIQQSLFGSFGNCEQDQPNSGLCKAEALQLITVLNMVTVAAACVCQQIRMDTSILKF